MTGRDSKEIRARDLDRSTHRGFVNGGIALMTHAHAVLFPKEQARASRACRICTRGLLYEQRRREEREEDQQGERAPVIFQKRRHRHRSGASFSLSSPSLASSSFQAWIRIEGWRRTATNKFPLPFSLRHHQRKRRLRLFVIVCNNCQISSYQWLLIVLYYLDAEAYMWIETGTSDWDRLAFEMKQSIVSFLQTINNSESIARWCDTYKAISG